MEKLTYRFVTNDKAYLKHGLDEKWRKLPRYEVIDSAIQKLAEYEELEEQGILLQLPCPIGTDVYYIFGIPGKTPCVIESTKFDLMDIKRIGVNMWITPEEAEAALEKMKGE